MGQISGKAVWTLAALLWLVPSHAAAHGSPDRGKTDSLLSRASSSGGDQRVIIRTKPGAQELVGRKLKARGEHVEKLHNLVPVVSARVNPRRLAELAADPDIESISADAEVRAHGARPAAVPSTTTLKDTLGITGWFSGSSVTVAILDSGLEPSGDFDGRVLGFYEFTAGKDGVAVAPHDDFGHGTHIAGLIGSNGSSSRRAFEGVAPGVMLLPLKVLNKNGVGRTSDVISALEFAVANKDRFGIDVVNLSLGHPVYESAATDPLVQAVEAASRAGLVVVVSAGNIGTNPYTGVTGYGGITSPGNAPSAITVGAANTNGTVVRSDDRVAPYSSRGPSWYDGVAKPDVVAPGHGLVSSYAKGSTLGSLYPDLLFKSGKTTFLKLSGSSMAAAVVSGLAAVMIDANEYAARQRWKLWYGSHDIYAAPTLTSNAIKSMLQFSATPLRSDAGSTYDHLTQGTGLVNGLGAIELAYHTDTTKPVGAYWLTAAPVPMTTFGFTIEPWAQAVVWGTRLLTGSSLVAIHQSAYDENIVWGTGEYDMLWGTVQDGENLVWGTAIAAGTDLTWAGNVALEENIVWGSFAGWDENIVWGTNLLGYFDGFNIVWGTTLFEENIVWGTLLDENIVWGTSQKKVTVLGSGGVQ
ncbi:MAG TPA: S8 family serine peptidase [Vicinamibacterales bacterium]|nr:S8 family serine peptidase [Vicinamibacterales bacterium]